MNPISKFYLRRNARLKSRGLAPFRMDADKDENTNNNNGGGGKSGGGGGGYSTRLPYGIAKGMGIDTTGMSPSDVWDALKGKGVSPTEEYRKLKERSKGKSKEGESKAAEKAKAPETIRYEEAKKKLEELDANIKKWDDELFSDDYKQYSAARKMLYEHGRAKTKKEKARIAGEIQEKFGLSVEDCKKKNNEQENHYEEVRDKLYEAKGSRDKLEKEFKKARDEEDRRKAKEEQDKNPKIAKEKRLKELEELFDPKGRTVRGRSEASVCVKAYEISQIKDEKEREKQKQAYFPKGTSYELKLKEFNQTYKGPYDEMQKLRKELGTKSEAAPKSTPKPASTPEPAVKYPDDAVSFASSLAKHRNRGYDSQPAEEKAAADKIKGSMQKIADLEQKDDFSPNEMKDLESKLKKVVDDLPDGTVITVDSGGRLFAGLTYFTKNNGKLEMKSFSGHVFGDGKFITHESYKDPFREMTESMGDFLENRFRVKLPKG